MVKTMKTIRWFVTGILIAFALLVLFSQYAVRKEVAPGGAEMQGGRVDFVVPGPQVEPEVAAREFLRKHKKEIEACEEQDGRSISFAVAELNRYFNLQDKQALLLVDDLFSISSKVRMACYFVGDVVMDDEILEGYLKERTEHYLGGPLNLRHKMKNITTSLKRDLQKNHNELMLALEADLALLPFKLGITNRGADAFVNDFEIAFNDTMKGMLPRTVGTQLGVEAIGLAIDFWVAPIIGHTVVQFLASRGIIAGGTLAAEGAAIGAGASLGPYTFGASLVAGTIIAIGIDWACNEMAKADATQKMRASVKAWRLGTVRSFKQSVSSGLDEFHGARRKTLKTALVLKISNLVKQTQP